MELHDLHPAPGAKKTRKRIGRGPGSGTGKTAGKGHKGQKSRSGYSRRYGFEGGQMPLVRRIPKRGFSNADFRKEYQIVNVASLDQRFEAGSRVDAEALKAARLIEDAAKPVKVLGRGELSKELTVVANKFSASAAEKIAKAGGAAEQA